MKTLLVVYAVLCGIALSGWVTMSPKDRHSFAHGQISVYGVKLPFDADKALQEQGWSERMIHRAGALVGACNETP